MFCNVFMFCSRNFCGRGVGMVRGRVIVSRVRVSGGGCGGR